MPPKSAPKNAKVEAPAKGAKAKTEKAVVAKSADKSKAKPAEKTEKKSNVKYEQCLAYIYGGAIIKASHVVVFALDNLDVAGHVRENLFQYYGNEVNARCVKCVDSEAAMNSLQAEAKKKKFCIDAVSPHILKCSVNEASDLLKKSCEVNTCNVVKFEEQEGKKKATASAKADSKAPAKPKGKTAAKKDVVEEAEEDEDEDEDEEDAEVSDEEDEDEDEEEDEDEDEEEESEDEQPQPKKNSKKK